MPEEKGKEKTPAENQEEEKKEEETPEEDPFADIFDNEEEEGKEEENEGEEGQEEEETPPEKKPKKKVAPTKPQVDVGQVVQQQLQEAERRLERRADTTEFLSSDRGRIFADNIQGFREKLRQAATSKKYQGVPVNKLPALILTEAAYEKAIATARQKADEEAADSVMIGGATRKTSGVPKDLQNINPLDMSAEEFAKLKEDAKRGKYKIRKQE